MLRNRLGRYLHHHELYPLLGLKPGQHLPVEGFEPRAVDGETYRCLPTNGGKHRVQALCECGRWIPFGRIGQHRKGKVHA